MRIDCQSCPAHGRRCGECVMTTLLALPGADPQHEPTGGSRIGSQTLGSAAAPGLEPCRPVSGGALALDEPEQHAVALFVAAGLVDRRHAAVLRARAEPAPGRRWEVGDMGLLSGPRGGAQVG